MTPKPKVAKSKIQPGVTVLIQMYNNPERKFYGEIEKARVIETKIFPRRSRLDPPIFQVFVERESGYKMWIRHYEVKGIADGLGEVFEEDEESS